MKNKKGTVMACSHCGQEYIVKNPPLGPYVCSKQVCKDAENKRLMETGEPNDIQRKFDETRAAEAKRMAGGHVATPADRAEDPYLSEDSIVYEATEEILICDTAPESAALTEYDEANARLIAAAPELLEACKFALDGLYSYRDIEGNCSAMSEREKLRDAIAKAEGREP